MRYEINAVAYCTRCGNRQYLRTMTTVIGRLVCEPCRKELNTWRDM
jgi:formylmethanofuran dehydrogenase subunit E